jgi:hypothetical protein
VGKPISPLWQREGGRDFTKIFKQLKSYRYSFFFHTGAIPMDQITQDGSELSMKKDLKSFYEMVNVKGFYRQQQKLF